MLRAACKLAVTDAKAKIEQFACGVQYAACGCNGKRARMATQERVSLRIPSNLQLFWGPPSCVVLQRPIPFAHGNNIQMHESGHVPNTTSGQGVGTI